MAYVCEPGSDRHPRHRIVRCGLELDDALVVPLESLKPATVRGKPDRFREGRLDPELRVGRDQPSVAEQVVEIGAYDEYVPGPAPLEKRYGIWLPADPGNLREDREHRRRSFRYEDELLELEASSSSYLAPRDVEHPRGNQLWAAALCGALGLDCDASRSDRDDAIRPASFERMYDLAWGEGCGQRLEQIRIQLVFNVAPAQHAAHPTGRTETARLREAWIRYRRNVSDPTRTLGATDEEDR